MDIREAMAREIAEQIGAEVLVERCDAAVNCDGARCRWPLMMKMEQGLAFCWGCATDRRNAAAGRTAYTKAKLKAAGILIGERADLLGSLL